MLAPLTEELSHPEDPLGCAAGLALVTQLAQQAGPAALGFLGNDLQAILRSILHAGDPFLKSSALEVLPLRCNRPSRKGILFASEGLQRPFKE